MKFTKKQIKQIIKEEIENYMFEIALEPHQTARYDYEAKKKKLAWEKQKSKGFTPGPLNIPPEEEWEEKQGIKIPPGFQFDDPREDPELSDDELNAAMARTAALGLFVDTLSPKDTDALKALSTEELKALENDAPDKTKWEAWTAFVRRKLGR